MAGRDPLDMRAARLMPPRATEHGRRLSLFVVAKKALDYGRRAITAFEFDGDLVLELNPSVDRLDLDKTNPTSHPAPHRYRADESHPIDPIVDHHRHALLIWLQHGRRQRSHQRKGEETMNDRAAERSLIGSLAGLMDPLRVVGGLGKRIDSILVDSEPLADSEFGSDE